MTAFACMLGGLILGAVGGAAMVAKAALLPVSAPTTGDAPAASRDVVNEHFVDRLVASFDSIGAPIGILNWAWGPDSALVLRLRPPSVDQPVVLWQSLDPEGRRGLTGLLRVRYTGELLHAGYAVDVRRFGYPPLRIEFAGLPETLAFATRDGRIVVGPSPFDAPPTSGTAHRNGTGR
jgi:hypothetical protein